MVKQEKAGRKQTTPGRVSLYQSRVKQREFLVDQIAIIFGFKGYKDQETIIGRDDATKAIVSLIKIRPLAIDIFPNAANKKIKQPLPGPKDALTVLREALRMVGRKLHCMRRYQWVPETRKQRAIFTYRIIA